MKKIYLFAFVLSALQFFAQPGLKPSIGLSALPNDNDAVCTIPVYNDPSGDFSASGFFVGDTIPHFQLFDRNGTAYDIAQILSQGKPVLLVGGNLTCPVFRAYIDSVNTYQTIYGSQVNIYVVYTVEAHPKSPDVSPYSGNVWVTSQNMNQNYLYNQPNTYLKRKRLVDTLMVRNPVNVPILIDGPCNEWWLNFGPAPNNAYLIKPDGVIAVKNGWFINPPQQWRNDIDSLLNVLSVTNSAVADLMNVSLYPNPVTNTVNLSADKTIEEVCVYDFSGKLIISQYESNNKKAILNVETLRPGAYFVRVKSGQDISTLQFIKADSH